MQPLTDRGEIVIGMPGGRRSAGVLLKRTYTFESGRACTPVEEDEQDPLSDSEIPYDELGAPFVSPVQIDNDLLAFRRLTDVVVQGAAYTYLGGVTSTDVYARIGSLERSIRVYGDRHLFRGDDGHLRFTGPEPFDALPLRYDRAYGGVDVVALRRRPAPKMLRELARAMPEVPVDTDTPFHYARNPSGRGFLIDDDDESIAGVRVPNLEFPFDPITPERLAAGSIHGWVDAPLPACMDWLSVGWFPRIAYLGGAWFPPGYRGPVRESELGWAAHDLIDIEPITWHLDELPRHEFAQAASPGMSVNCVLPGAQVELRNLHPVDPVYRFRLPGEMPHVRMEMQKGVWEHLEPHLNSVVIRPESDEVVMTWCCTGPVDRGFPSVEPEEIRREIRWDAEGGVG